MEEADDRATASCPDPDAAERNQKVGSWFIFMVHGLCTVGFSRASLGEEMLEVQCIR